MSALKTLQDPEGRFAAIIEPVTEAHGCRLVHVRMGGSQAGSGNALEIFVERRDGQPLDMQNCADISREAGAILDVEDTVAGAYRLEVGSPGIDRPLSSIEDFLRFKGFEAKIEFKRSLADGQKRMRGRITDVSPKGFKFHDDQNRDFEFELNDLSAAKLVATDDLVKLAQKGQFPKQVQFNDNQALEA
ncbi:MAG TPA: ribosome maturation factor RimP [Alphaproteobacteria bacterium]